MQEREQREGEAQKARRRRARTAPALKTAMKAQPCASLSRFDASNVEADGVTPAVLSMSKPFSKDETSSSRGPGRIIPWRAFRFP